MDVEEKYCFLMHRPVFWVFKKIFYQSLQIFTQAFYWHGFPLSSHIFIDYNASKQPPPPPVNVPNCLVWTHLHPISKKLLWKKTDQHSSAITVLRWVWGSGGREKGSFFNVLYRDTGNYQPSVQYGATYRYICIYLLFSYNFPDRSELNCRCEIKYSPHTWIITDFDPDLLWGLSELLS